MIRLKELRKQKKISQLELAQIIGVSRSTVAMWETNNNEPDNETLIKLAKFFDVSVDYLLGRTDSTGTATNDINLDELEFALYGEMRELDDEDKEELLRNARRMRELLELKKKQSEQQG